MKRRLRVLTLTITAFSVLLILATCGMWIRSRYLTDEIIFSRFQHKFTMKSNFSGLLLRVDALNPTSTTATFQAVAKATANVIAFQFSSLYVGASAPGQSKQPRMMISATSIEMTQIRYQGHGLQWSSGFSAKSVTFPGPFPACRIDALLISYADLAVVFAIVLSVTSYVAIRNRKTHPKGCCSKCGYDLRATPDRCPECGTIPYAVAISPEKTPSKS
jgi:hypothetical protein